MYKQVCILTFLLDTLNTYILQHAIFPGLLKTSQQPKSHVSMTTYPPSTITSLSSSSPAILSCSAAGSPLPSISWFKNNILISTSRRQTSGLGETSSTLTIPCQEEEVASYACVATAGEETAQATTEVVAEENEECHKLLEVKTWSTTVMVEQGTDVILPCLHQLGSFLLPSYWSLSGISSSIPDSDKHQSSPAGDLVIRGVTWGDMGLYSCHGGDGEKMETFLYPLAGV